MYEFSHIHCHLISSTGIRIHTMTSSQLLIAHKKLVEHCTGIAYPSPHVTHLYSVCLSSPPPLENVLRGPCINKFDQGLRFVPNPTKSTKRRPVQNCLKITSKWFERENKETRNNKKQETRNKEQQDLKQDLWLSTNLTRVFVLHITLPNVKKRRPLQNRFEITSKWLEHGCRPKQKQGTTRLTTRFAVIKEFYHVLRFVFYPT